MQNSWIITSWSRQNAIDRSTELASWSSSLSTGNVTWMRAGRAAPCPGSCTGSGVVMGQQDLDDVLRLVGNQLDGALGLLERQYGIEQSLRRDGALPEGAHNQFLQILGVERRRTAHRIGPRLRRQRRQQRQPVVIELFAEIDAGVAGAVVADTDDTAALAG